MEHFRFRIYAQEETSSVAYHFVREGVSRDEWRTTHVKSQENPADLMTKKLAAGVNHYQKVKMILYDIYPQVEENINLEEL